MLVKTHRWVPLHVFLFAVSLDVFSDPLYSFTSYFHLLYLQALAPCLSLLLPLDTVFVSVCYWSRGASVCLFKTFCTECQIIRLICLEFVCVVREMRIKPPLTLKALCIESKVKYWCCFDQMAFWSVYFTPTSPSLPVWCITRLIDCIWITSESNLWCER